MIDLLQTLVLIALAVAQLATHHNTKDRMGLLFTSMQGLRAQNLRDRKNAPSARPILRNRELMKAGDKIADGSLHN